MTLVRGCLIPEHVLTAYDTEKSFVPCNATSCLFINVQGLQFDSMRTTDKMFALVLYGVLRSAETSLKWKRTRAFYLKRRPS